MQQQLALLKALQLADSAFPTGMYAHSQGLEGLVRTKLVADPTDVEELLTSELTWSVLPADGVALLNAYRAASNDDLSELIEIDRLLFAMRWPGELRGASTQLGRRLFAIAADFDGGDLCSDYRAAVERSDSPGAGAVAMGVVAAEQSIPADTALSAYCHSFTMGVLSAAQRLLPISHTDTQAILYRSHELVARLMADIGGRPWQEMSSFMPELDIASADHESASLRMFAS